MVTPALSTDYVAHDQLSPPCSPRKSSWSWGAVIVAIKDAWRLTQVSHRGKYSIERLLALDEYVRKTSFARVLFVCFASPVPVIALVLTQESVPLQDPDEGWRANFGIWVRAGVVAGVVTHTIIVQLQNMVDDVVISPRQVVTILIAAMVTYTAMCVVIAKNLFFPIPFMSITMTLPYLIVLAFLFYFVVGGQAIREILHHKGQLLRFAAFLAAQTLMSVMYPAYQILFQVAANSGYELLVVALLPVLKAVMKNIVSLSFYRMQDLMPEGVIFTVDFFNAFYIATSMQNASSTMSVIVIMAADVSNTVLALKGLREGTSNLIYQQCDLLQMARSLCRNPGEFEMQHRTGIQLRSCVNYEISGANQAFMDQLSKYSDYRAHTRSSIRSASGRLVAIISIINSRSKLSKRRWRWQWFNRWCAMVHPVVIASVQPKKDIDATLGTFTHALPCKHSELAEILKLLFTLECLVLAEYLESVVPILYANYIVVMVHLPSSCYHLELAGITTANVDAKVQVVFAYALLEFISFLAVAVVVQRRCRMKILYQLAFVLETHMPLIQDKLMAWTLLTLAARVVHFGIDFTFQFPWLKR